MIIQSLLFIVLVFFSHFSYAQESACCIYSTPSLTISSSGTQANSVVSTVAFSQSGCLAAGYGDGTLRIFTPSTSDMYPTSSAHATTIIEPPLPVSAIQSLTFSQNGCLIAGSRANGILNILAPFNNSCLYTSIQTIEGGSDLISLATSNTNCLAAAFNDRTVKLFAPTAAHTYNPSAFTVIPFSELPLSIAFSNTGCLAVGLSDGTVQLFSLSDPASCLYNTTPTNITSPGLAPAVSIAFSQNGCLAVAYGDGMVRIYTPLDLATCSHSINPTDATTIIPAFNPLFPPSNVTFSNNGCLAIGYTNGTIKTFTPTDATVCIYNTVPTSTLTSMTSPIIGLAFSPTGYLAAHYQNNSITIYAPNSILAATITGNTNLHSGDTLQLTAPSSTGTPPYLFTWTGPNGFTAYTQTITIPHVTTAHVGIYTAIVTDRYDCITRAQATVTTNLAVTLRGPATLCTGKTIKLAAHVSNGIAPFTFSWTGPRGFTSLNQSITRLALPVNAGVYTVTVTDATGCTGTANILITINNRPITALEGQTDVCKGVPIELSSQVTAGSPPYSFTWTGPHSFTATTATITRPATFENAGTYTLVVTDTNRCKGIADATVTVNEQPTVTIHGNTSVCEGTIIKLSAHLQGGTRPFSFVWTGPNNFTSRSQTITQDALFHNTGTYTITITDVHGCTSTASTNVTVHEKPLVTIQGNTKIAERDSITLTAQVQKGSEPYVFTWTGPRNFRATTQTISRSATLNRAGTYSVTVTDRNGCKDTLSTDITVIHVDAPLIQAFLDHSIITITGTAEKNSSITIFQNTIPIGTTTTDASGSFHFTSNRLANGVHTFTAHATNARGYTSRLSNTLSLTIDCRVALTLPSCPITNNAKPTITGRSTPTSIITLFAHDTLLGTTQTDSLGNFSFTPVHSLVDDTYKITAALTTRSGIIVASDTITITIETRERNILSQTLVHKYCISANIPKSV